MKTLVVYESFFGNTEKVAQAVGKALGSGGQVLKFSDFTLDALKGVELLVVGSPTRAFQPTPGIKSILKTLPAGSLNGMRAAAFDTRMDVKKVNNGILTFFAGIFGYAAEPIAKALVKKGAALAQPAEGFIVEGSEGPMPAGELERAAEWAKKLLK
jgi:flavodoxin I